MKLHTWGNENGKVCITFYFRHVKRVCYVVCWTQTRNDAYRLLRKFRKARQWVDSIFELPEMPANEVARYSLRWLACKWCYISVRAQGKHQFGFIAPPGYVKRPTPDDIDHKLALMGILNQ